MSRCFPFPPPGYEKRARVYNTDLLTKEKLKEKKHKKDKKDKEKREGKGRRDKDRSKEKHREKKDSKEKHKDKEERKEKHGDKDGDRDKGKTRNSDERTVAHRPGLYNGKMLGSNSLQNDKIMEYKFVQELARRIGDEDRASGSQMVRNIAVMEQRRDELLGTSMGSFSGSQLGGRQRVTDKNEDPEKLNGQGSHVGASSWEIAYDRNFSVDARERVEGITKTVEKDAEKQMEGKPKSKHKESEKRKGRDEEKKRKSKDKDRDKGKKKEEKAKKITEQSKEQPKLKESGSELEGSSKDDPLDFRNTNQTNPLKLSSVSFSGEGNLGKRKELEINGFLTGESFALSDNDHTGLEKGNRPNKISRPLSSSHPVPENGRKLEPGQNAVQIGSEKQAEANNHRMDMNEHKTNGSITSIPPNTSSTRPLPANTVVKENGEASLKPPHPDIKYLSRVLSVPNPVELPDIVDDQEWLFGSNKSQSKASNVTSRGYDETRQVWAEAVRIDSADVSALPFVIPF